ncbi:MAG TPA: hypothetical protein VG710_00065 [Opitutus sp.]|nr:hypothetical protein [Opitutus sp.]
MYPTQELKDLAKKKETLRGRIARERLEAAAAAAELARPVGWIERAVAKWRQLSPWVKAGIVPVALLLRRRFPARLRRSSRTMQVLRWAPLVLRAVRVLAERRS